MISRRTTLFGALLLSFGIACAPNAPTAGQVSTNAPAGDPNAYTNPQILAETTQLADKLTQPNLRIVDMRTKEKYAAGHLPGAVSFDTSLLKDPDDKLFVPRPEIFSKLMGGLGISNETVVVAYDDSGGLGPARLWWTLEYYGHGKAQILNGGWNKWTKENRPTVTDAPTIPAATFNPKIVSDVICALDVVEKATDNQDYVIVDARTAAEFNGTDVRANRGGHVPNAVNIDWQRNVTTDDVKAWKPAAELRKMYEDAGVKPNKKIITYCQTAVRASHTLFTLRLLGYGNVQNYDGSWAEWGNNPNTPIKR